MLAQKNSLLGNNKASTLVNLWAKKAVMFSFFKANWIMKQLSRELMVL